MMHGNSNIKKTCLSFLYHFRGPRYHPLCYSHIFFSLFLLVCLPVTPYSLSSFPLFHSYIYILPCLPYSSNKDFLLSSYHFSSRF